MTSPSRLEVRLVEFDQTDLDCRRRSLRVLAVKSLSCAHRVRWS